MEREREEEMEQVTCKRIGCKDHIHTYSTIGKGQCQEGEHNSDEEHWR